MFWSESASYIALYLVFAAITCGILAGLELHNQTGSIALPRIALRAAVLLSASTVLFAGCLYLLSWQSKWFGSEGLAFLVLSVAWVALAYAINRALLNATGLEFANPALYTWLPVLVLVSPFVAFNAFAMFLGSRWGI